MKRPTSTFLYIKNSALDSIRFLPLRSPFSTKRKNVKKRQKRMEIIILSRISYIQAYVLSVHMLLFKFPLRYWSDSVRSALWNRESAKWRVRVPYVSACLRVRVSSCPRVQTINWRARVSACPRVQTINWRVRVSKL